MRGRPRPVLNASPDKGLSCKELGDRRMVQAQLVEQLLVSLMVALVRFGNLPSGTCGTADVLVDGSICVVKRRSEE